MRLVDVDEALEKIEGLPDLYYFAEWYVDYAGVCNVLKNAPTVDAIPVADIESWLYQIAMNNTGNPLSAACVEIINRLECLRQFSRERDCEDGN